MLDHNSRRELQIVGLVSLVVGAGVVALDPASRNGWTYVPAAIGAIIAYYPKEICSVVNYF